MEASIERLQLENDQLQSEIAYYRSILFADGNTRIYSIVNSLRTAVDIKAENDTLRKQSGEIHRLQVLCEKLEGENASLRKALADADKRQ